MTDAQKEKTIRYLLSEIDALLADVAVLRQRIEYLKNGDNPEDLFTGEKPCRN